MNSMKPKELKGNWTKGYSLDTHTISNTYLVDDEFRHPRFDTKRSELGELIIRLIYRDDKSILNDILESIPDFLKNNWKIINNLDYIDASISFRLTKDSVLHLIKLTEK